MQHVTLIRYDEIGLKGKNRRFFEGRLRENVARALGLPPSAVVRERGRLFVQHPEGRPPQGATVRALGRVFGIRSFSPALRLPHELPLVTEAVLRLAGEAVARGGRTFAMESRRSEKSFPLTSLELNARLGRAVQERHPGLAVNLDRPEFTLHVEVRESGTYMYEEIHPGPGGLPVGASGRALLLLSGGIDSPVAGWMALKRGISLDAIHFHTAPYTGPQSRERAVAIARELAGWRGQPFRVHLVSLTAAQLALARAVPERLWTLAQRRMMVRVAEAIARRERYLALVTGDSLGQVASQTLENIGVVDRAVAMPVLRPLVGFDKAEIVDRARRIGTYRLSVQPFEDCCLLFAPQRPETRARLEEMLAAESRLHMEELVGAALERAEVVHLEPALGRLPLASERTPASSDRTSSGATTAAEDPLGPPLAQKEQPASR